MAKFLFATVPITGHVVPGLPLARRLVEQGSDVAWYSTSNHRARIESTGSAFYPVRQASDFDDRNLDAAFPGRVPLDGLKKLKFDLKYVFAGQMIPWFQDIQAILKEFPADVVVADSGFTGLLPMVLAPPHPKLAVYGAVPLTVTSRDTAPFGLGLPPARGAAGRVRNRLLNALIQNFAFADIQKVFNRHLTEAGVGRMPCFFMDGGARLSDVFLQGSCPSFEYPRSDLPPSVQYVGPFLPPQSGGFDEPDWWSDLGEPTPVVYVTQGTVANQDFGQLLRPTIEGLAGEDVLVIATTGGRPVGEVGGHLPANVRVETFVPHRELLPHVDVMVTNGGYGGVQQALYFGVPLVVAGTSEDKVEVNARVGWSGAGINLAANRPEPAKVREAVKAVLGTPSYAQRAQVLCQEFQSYDAERLAVDALLRLSGA